MKSIKFFASLGVLAGYSHNNTNVDLESALKIAGKAWQNAAGKIFKDTEVYVSAVIIPSVTVYNQDWGCPEGGEVTVFISGECNPQYTALDKYKEAVKETLRATAETLGQSTTQLTFQEVDFEHIDFRKVEA